MFSANRLFAKYVCSPKNGPVPNQDGEAEMATVWGLARTNYCVPPVFSSFAPPFFFRFGNVP